jgi:hypothetical protein
VFEERCSAAADDTGSAVNLREAFAAVDVGVASENLVTVLTEACTASSDLLDLLTLLRQSLGFLTDEIETFFVHSLELGNVMALPFVVSVFRTIHYVEVMSQLSQQNSTLAFARLFVLALTASSEDTKVLTNSFDSSHKGVVHFVDIFCSGFHFSHNLLLQILEVNDF